MATAGELELMRGACSMNSMPPSMSEQRVVLLGNSWSDRSSVGNFILGETVFNNEDEPHVCLSVKQQLKDKDIVLINTPDLLHPNISENKVREHVKNCVRLADPGPHVFLLVLQPKGFTEELRVRLCRVLQLFGHQSFDHSLILITRQREENPCDFDKDVCNQDQPLQTIIEMSGNRCLKHLKNLEISELLTKMDETAKKNDGEHGSHDVSVPKALHSLGPRSSGSLNLVLCGRRGAGKTSAGEAILGQKERHSLSSKSQGEVCGRWVSLVELPALYEKPPEEVMEESFRCVALCDPEGVHAFILVLPVGPLTEEDKGELETLQNTFSSRVNDFTMILFTVDSDPRAPAVVGFIEENENIQKLCRSCGGGYFVLNIKNKLQIPDLLETVEKCSAEGSRCFTKDMFTKAQMETVTKLRAGQQHAKVSQEMGEDQTRECLRMVLIGKTGSGKSATANTILGEKHFKPRVAPKPPTKFCERAKGGIDGRPVAVVNTPALFDTTLSEDTFQQEIKKSISLLSPGPHVFLLVLQIGNLTPLEETSVELIKRVFGQKAEDFIIIIFTRGDELDDQSFENYVKESSSFLKLMKDCEGRYQVFNNKNETDRTQVRELLTKIDAMVKQNGGCYNTEMTQLVKEARMEIEQTVNQKLEELKSEMEARSKQDSEQRHEEMRKLTQQLDDMSTRKKKEKGDKCCIV